MQLKTTTDYAIRVVLFLALRKEITSSVTISKELDISWKYLINIGGKLKDAGLIYTYQGKNGGYTLAKAPETIRIYDILVAVDDSIKISQLIRERVYNSSDAIKTNQISIFYHVAQEKMELFFKSITILNLLDNVNESEIRRLLETSEKRGKEGQGGRENNKQGMLNKK